MQATTRVWLEARQNAPWTHELSLRCSSRKRSKSTSPPVPHNRRQPKPTEIARLCMTHIGATTFAPTPALEASSFEVRFGTDVDADSSTGARGGELCVTGESLCRGRSLPSCAEQIRSRGDQSVSSGMEWTSAGAFNRLSRILQAPKEGR